MHKTRKFKTGIILIAVSVFLFASLLIIPFLSFDKQTKITVTTIAFVLAEVTFYSGGALLGKEIFSKYKSWFNPKNWFKKKAKTTTVENHTHDNS